MPDLLDAAQDLELMQRQQAIDTARRVTPVAVATGNCLHCDAPVVQP